MTSSPAPPVLDAHHHLWDSSALDYSLMDGPLQALRGCYDAAVFDEIAHRHGISGSVCVEAASAGADGPSETSWLLAQAAKSTIVRGVVAWAPIGTGTSAQYIDGLLERAGGLVIGVRRSFEFSPPAALMTAAVRRDVRAAGERGLSVDLVLFEESLPQAYELVRASSNVRFVLDHLGKPRVGRRAMGSWQKWMAALGRLENIVCKISGLAVEARDPDWSVDDLTPYLDTALESFGWQRILFGTDWPVCDLAGGVERWLEAVQAWTSSCTTAERSRLYWDNAVSFWDLDRRRGEP